MDREFLQECLSQGMATRDIGKIVDKNSRTISYWINKYNMTDQLKYKKNPNFVFDKIDTEDKAYVLGFILADGAIYTTSETEITVSIADKEVVEYISKIINSNVMYDNYFDKKTKRFPYASTTKKIKDILKFVGGCKKEERHYPRVRSDLEKYLLQGVFDADGCITWGYRKDKHRMWQKVSFTSSLKILLGVQQYLLKNLQISTSIKPKKDCKCYVMDFSNKNDVLKFLDHIYSDDDFIILHRKYLKAKALRLELEENGEGVKRQ